MGVDQKVSGMTVLTQNSGCADENAGSSGAKHSKGGPRQRRSWFTKEQSRRRDYNGVKRHNSLCNLTPEELTGGCGVVARSGSSSLVITRCLFSREVGKTFAGIMGPMFS